MQLWPLNDDCMHALVAIDEVADAFVPLQNGEPRQRPHLSSSSARAIAQPAGSGGPASDPEVQNNPAGGRLSPSDSNMCIVLPTCRGFAQNHRDRFETLDGPSAVE